jgi:hypothetical protein
MVGALLLVASGCAGLNTTQSVSPLMFLVPGLGKATPAAPPAPGEPQPTPPLGPQLALVR